MEETVTIEVEPGTYEGFTVDVAGLVLEGNGAFIEGQITISAPGVTLRGFEITNPNGGYGVLIQGVGGVSILENTISEVGTMHGNETAQGIYVEAKNGEDFGDIVISDNTISDIGHSDAKTSKGIFFGDTAANANITSALVSNNAISSVSANSTAWVSGGAGGQGAYGILVNVGTETASLIIESNTISDLSGLWVHAIGLEGDTPDAQVINNEIADLAATKGDLVDTGAFRDEVGVFFEDNSSAPSVTVSGNSFEGMYYGVRLHPDEDLGEESVDASGNWWGDATGPFGSGARIEDGIIVTTWLDAPQGSERDHNVAVAEKKFNSIPDALDDEDTISGSTLNVLSGVHVIDQIVLDEDITIAGEDRNSTILKPNADFTGNNAGHAWILISEGVTVALTDLTLDGNDHWVHQAVRNHGNTTISNAVFKNIQGSFDGSPYRGIAISSYGGTVSGGGGADTHAGGLSESSLTVTDTVFTHIGRIGILIKGTGASADISGNTYTGKGEGNFLDYGVEVGAGGSAVITSNEISDNRGVASTDGSTSAGILVTDYFGPGTEAVIENNILTNNSSAVVVGYTGDDESVVTMRMNDLSSNNTPVRTSAPTVDAIENWWGVATASSIEALVEGDVLFDPWYLSSSRNALSSDASEGTLTPSGGGDYAVETSGQVVRLPDGVSKVALGNTSELDLSAGLANNKVVLETGAGSTVTLSNTALPTVSVTIPDQTEIEGPAGWNGKIQPPRTETASGNAPAGFSVGGTVISVGSSQGTLRFDKPVTLLLEGVTGTVGYKPALEDNWVEITNGCNGTFAAPTLSNGNECSITNGTDTKIVTNHFTLFGSLVAASSGGSASGSTATTAPSSAPSVPSAGEGVVLGAATFQFTAHMTIGSRGTDVTELQRILRSAGYFNLEPTGYFGPITEAAVKQYQEANGIPATGYVGPLTLAALNTAPDAQTQLTALRQQALALMQQLLAQLQAQLEAAE